MKSLYLREKMFKEISRNVIIQERF